MSWIVPSLNDTKMQSIGKGILIGGALTAGAYGLHELKEYIAKRLEMDTDVFPKGQVLQFEKKSAWEPIPWFLAGAGIPIGGLMAYKAIDEIRNKEEKAKIRSKLRELEMAIKESALREDPEVNNFLDGFTKEALGPGDVIDFLVDSAGIYYPIGLGMAAGTSGIAGYYGAKYMMDPDADEPEDILNPPELSYKFRKKAGWWGDWWRNTKAGGKVLADGVGHVAGVLNYAIENAPKDLERTITRIGTNINSGVLDYAHKKYPNNAITNPGKWGQKAGEGAMSNLFSTQGIGALLGAGTLMGLPGAIMGRMGRQQHVFQPPRPSVANQFRRSQ